MARLGRNPAKSVKGVPTPNKVTVAIVFYAPDLNGYFKESIEVFSLSLESLYKNSDVDFDLIVFDNNSCQKAQEYLTEQYNNGKIQYLILSDKNVGKVAAMNYLFAASPGEYIAFSDSDIFFHPGWMSKSIEILKEFPDVGTVTGCPIRRKPTYYSNTMKIAKKNNLKIDIGQFIPEEWSKKHIENSGINFDDYIKTISGEDDYRIIFKNISSYANSGHFQFMISKKVANKIMPIPVTGLVGANELLFDEAIDKHYMRLATTERLTEHIGNSLSGHWGNVAKKYNVDTTAKELKQTKRNSNNFIYSNKYVKKLLLAISNRIIRKYY